MSRAPASTKQAVGAVPGITIGIASLAWLASWVAGNLLSAVVVGATGRAAQGATPPVWVTAVGAVALWVPMVVVLREVSQRFGTRSMATDYGARFRPVDLIGLPIGAACQVGLLRLVYWPLSAIWKDAFSDARLERAARKLSDSATGGWIVVLVLVVVVGAPLVEELVYRGLLQGTFTRCAPRVPAMVAVAAWFALIHFVPVEYPGLFAFGLVLGICTLRTGRIGMGVCAHVAFNAAGLVMVAHR
jgi:hypothetical protein